MSPALEGAVPAGVSTNSVTPNNNNNIKSLNQRSAISTTRQGSTTTSTNIIASAPNMLPAGVQIVNMRPGAPTIQHATTTTVQQQQQQQQVQVQQQQQQNQQQQQLSGQRTVATVQPRIVIGSQNVVTTANNRQAPNSLQLGQGPTLLLKTESGQFQLLRVGTAPAGAGQATGAAGGVQHTTITNQTGIVTTGAGGNQTIRLQTMPASTPTSNIVLTSHAATASNAHATVASVPPVVPSVVVSSSSVAAAASSSAAPTMMVTTQAAPQQQQQQATNANQQNTKEKCRKFLANLLDLSNREPKSVEKNVRTLIQELIDNQVEPEGFCHRLERLLNASPQPCLIGFLKKSLPVLRQSLVRKELTIDGIRPPPLSVAFPNAVAIGGTTTIPAMMRPVGQQAIIPRMGAPGITAAAPRPTTITRHTPVRIGAAPRLAVNQLRPVTAIPALQPMRTATPTSAGGAMIRPVAPAGSLTKVVKVGQTQIKQVTANASGGHVVVSRAPGLTSIQRPAAGTTTIVNASAAATSSSSAAASGAAPSQASAMSAAASSGSATATTPATSAAAAAAQKERKASFNQHNSISSSSIYGDDEINDVAAMGGVNLAEESQRILGSTELIGTQIRSCKDEVFLHLPALQSKIRAIVARHGLEEASPDVAVLVSHAAQERLKNIVEKLSVIAEHRVDVIKLDTRYEVTKDVRSQVKFLEELDKAEQKRHDEQEREMLLRAAKSRTKTEDPEQAKLKAKAKEMQRAEMEELRQRDANLTALQAIGMRKKPRLDGDAASSGAASGSSGGGSGSGFSSSPLRPRFKRVNLRDMIFYLEQERETCRSSMLYRAYLK